MNRQNYKKKWKGQKMSSNKPDFTDEELGAINMVISQSALMRAMQKIQKYGLLKQEEAAKKEKKNKNKDKKK